MIICTVIHTQKAINQMATAEYDPMQHAVRDTVLTSKIKTVNGPGGVRYRLFMVRIYNQEHGDRFANHAKDPAKKEKRWLIDVDNNTKVVRVFVPYPYPAGVTDLIVHVELRRMMYFNDHEQPDQEEEDEDGDEEDEPQPQQPQPQQLRLQSQPQREEKKPAEPQKEKEKEKETEMEQEQDDSSNSEQAKSPVSHSSASVPTKGRHPWAYWSAYRNPKRIDERATKYVIPKRGSVVDYWFPPAEHKPATDYKLKKVLSAQQSRARYDQEFSVGPLLGPVAAQSIKERSILHSLVYGGTKFMNMSVTFCREDYGPFGKQYQCDDTKLCQFHFASCASYRLRDHLVRGNKYNSFMFVNEQFPVPVKVSLSFAQGNYDGWRADSMYLSAAEWTKFKEQVAAVSVAAIIADSIKYFGDCPYCKISQADRDAYAIRAGKKATEEEVGYGDENEESGGAPVHVQEKAQQPAGDAWDD